MKDYHEYYLDFNIPILIKFDCKNMSFIDVYIKHIIFENLLNIMSSVHIQKIETKSIKSISKPIIFDDFKTERCFPLNKTGTAYLLVSYIPEHLIKCGTCIQNIDTN